MPLSTSSNSSSKGAAPKQNLSVINNRLSSEGKAGMSEVRFSKESSSRSHTPSGHSMLKTSTEKSESGVNIKSSTTRCTTECEDPTYRSYISPRSTTIITRSGQTPLASGCRTASNQYGGTTYQRTVEISSGLAPSSYNALANADASAVRSDREKEKRDMQDLNERLANYIEKVRFLEAQNRKLANELEQLKDRWGKDSSRIKDMYESELKEARELIDRTEKEKAGLEIRLHTAEDELNDLKRCLEEMTRCRNADRETVVQQQQTLADYEAEMNLMKRRLGMLEEDRERDRKEISRLQQEIIKLKFDLDAETLNHIDAENRRQTLEEELEFMRNVHEQEMKDLAALAYRDSTPENREYWRNELAQAIRDIQCEYENRMTSMKAEYETYYNMKISEVRTANTKTGLEGAQLKEDIKKLRSTITEMRGRESDMDARNMLLEKELDLLKRDFDERERDWDKERVEMITKQRELQQTLDDLTRQFADLNDKKLSLELEIAAYRRLLEGEEKSMGLRQAVENYHASTQQTLQQKQEVLNQVIKGEMSAKTTYQRSAKGPITIGEVSAEGKFISLENTGKKDETIEGWQVRRSVDNKKELAYQLPRVTISPGKSKAIKIWVRGVPPKGDYDLQSDIDSWGVGSNVFTALYNDKGEERATHTQKTVYTS